MTGSNRVATPFLQLGSYVCVSGHQSGGDENASCAEAAAVLETVFTLTGQRNHYML